MRGEGKRIRLPQRKIPVIYILTRTSVDLVRVLTQSRFQESFITDRWRLKISSGLSRNQLFTNYKESYFGREVQSPKGRPGPTQIFTVGPAPGTLPTSPWDGPWVTWLWEYMIWTHNRFNVSFQKKWAGRGVGLPPLEKTSTLDMWDPNPIHTVFTGEPTVSTTEWSDIHGVQVTKTRVVLWSRTGL